MLGKMRWAGYVVCMEEMRNAYTVFIGKSEVKRLHRRPRYRGEDNTVMDLMEIGGKLLTGFIWSRIGVIDRLL